MTQPSSGDRADDLNFDRAESASGTSGAAPDRCGNCGKPVGETYHTVNGTMICASCRGRLQSAAAPVRSPATLGKAIAAGFGAAVVGAIIYYAVMRYFNLEIGLVAILTGWMVGKAMQKATAGRGGRLLQVSAGLLTYVSVAMAYFPFAVQQMNAASQEAASAQAEGAPTVAAPTEPESQSVPGGESAGLNPVVGLIIVAGFALILPILVIVGSMPSGLISAVIIGFGMLQAWQLTGAPTLAFEGPFRLAPKQGDGDAGLAGAPG